MSQTDLHKRFQNVSTPLEPIPTNTEPKLKELQDIQVIVYDFYGTLFLSGVGDIGVDDGKYDSEALLDALRSAEIEILNNDAGSKGFEIYNEIVENIIENIRHEGNDYPEPDIREVWYSVLKRLKEQSLIKNEPSAEASERISVEFEARMNPVWPVPGAIQTLLSFKEEGYTQGIISNSQFYTPIVLEALSGYTLDKIGLEKGLLHWSFEEKMKKPSLTFYQKFLQKLSRFDDSISAGNVLYVGNDMLKDIYPARELGMKTALFAGDQRSLKWRKNDERCKNIMPDLVITNFDQLRNCLSSD
jgi:putative hydrolase of the HAD superfamily